MRPVRLFALLAAGLTAAPASAQVLDYLRGAFRGGQQPLGSSPTGKIHPVEITTDNWLASVNATAGGPGLLDGVLETSENPAQEWMFYFTHSNYTGTKDLRFWDGVFNVYISYTSVA